MLIHYMFVFIIALLLSTWVGLVMIWMCLQDFLEENNAAQQSFALDGATAERTTSVSCPHCNRQVEIVLLVSPRK